MLEAILFERGSRVDIYNLEDRGRSEVRKFLESNIRKPETSGIVAGFQERILNIAEEGFNHLTTSMSMSH